jgi:predicted DNA-binding transcriptional regulator YafY
MAFSSVLSVNYPLDLIPLDLHVIVYGNKNIFAVKIINISIDLFVPVTALFSDADVIFAEPIVCIDDVRNAYGVLPRLRCSYTGKVFVQGFTGCVGTLAIAKDSVCSKLTIIPIGEIASLKGLLELVVSLRVLSSHLFTLPEVKLLMDAVESSKFITAKKSSELAEKLSQMTSVYQSEELKRNIYISERVKPMNEQIYYLVDNINTAINQGKQISFLYFHYNQYREEVPNNDGKRYHFSPYYLVWNEDHYYVVGFCEKHQRITTFRVDRMKSISILCSDAVPQPKDFNLPDFTRQVFDMYDGTKEKVTLLCKNELMNYIVDKFGDEVETSPTDDSHFKAVVEVSVSQTFFAWVFQFNGEVKIANPSADVSRYREMLENALK